MRLHRYRMLGRKFGVTAERSPIGTVVGDPRPRISWSVSLFIGRYEYSASHLTIKEVTP